ncbi:MAG: hypothetical protein WCO52_00530 [bacterium]
MNFIYVLSTHGTVLCVDCATKPKSNGSVIVTRHAGIYGYCDYIVGGELTDGESIGISEPRGIVIYTPEAGTVKRDGLWAPVWHSGIPAEHTAPIVGLFPSPNGLGDISACRDLLSWDPRWAEQSFDLLAEMRQLEGVIFLPAWV